MSSSSFNSEYDVEMKNLPAVAPAEKSGRMVDKFLLLVNFDYQIIFCMFCYFIIRIIGLLELFIIGII